MKDPRPLYSEMPAAAAFMVEARAKIMTTMCRESIDAIATVAAENDGISGAVELAAVFVVELAEQVAARKNIAPALALEIVTDDMNLRLAMRVRDIPGIISDADYGRAMRVSGIIDAIHECDDEQLALVFEAVVQRVGVVGEAAVASIMELMSGRPEDGDFADGLDLLQGFVTGSA